MLRPGRASSGLPARTSAPPPAGTPGGLLSSGELQAARQAAAERAGRAEDGIREQHAAIEKLNAQITRVVQAANGQAWSRPRPPARRVPREQAEYEL